MGWIKKWFGYQNYDKELVYDAYHPNALDSSRKSWKLIIYEKGNTDPIEGVEFNTFRELKKWLGLK